MTYKIVEVIILKYLLVDVPDVLGSAVFIPVTVILEVMGLGLQAQSYQ
jgi:hypothetical protein